MNNPAETNQTMNQSPSLPFRWSYVALPMVVTAFTILLTVIFYGLLPEQVAYRLRDDSGALVNRGALAAWLIIPQVLFTLGSFGLVKLVLMAARYADGDNALIMKIVPLVGNMTTIVQVVILLAAVQIFLYNAYEIHTGPLWAPAVVVLAIGAIYLAARFAGYYRQARRQRKEVPTEKRNA